MFRPSCDPHKTKEVCNQAKKTDKNGEEYECEWTKVPGRKYRSGTYGFLEGCFKGY